MEFVHYVQQELARLREMSLWPWLCAAMVLAVWLVVSFGVKAVVFGRLRRLATKTATRVDDLLISSLNLPLNVLIFVTAILAVAHFTPLGAESGVEPYVAKALLIGGVLAAVLFFDRLFRSIIALYGDRVPLFQVAGGLLQSLSRGIVVVLGLLVLAESLGVSITPLLASLGIGSLAVALALQPTLENFFSGVQIVMDRQVQQGHFIRLETGEEGYVEKVGWRSTWLRTLTNNMVVVPNKVLVTSRVLNYDYPSKECTILIPVGVHYGSSLEHVEKIAMEVAQEIVNTVPGVFKEFAPAVRFHTFGNSSVDLNVVIRVEDMPSSYRVKSETIKALHARFAKERITIPFPIVALNLDQERAAGLLASAPVCQPPSGRPPHP